MKPTFAIIRFNLLYIKWKSSSSAQIASMHQLFLIMVHQTCQTRLWFFLLGVFVFFFFLWISLWYQNYLQRPSLMSTQSVYMGCFCRLELSFIVFFIFFINILRQYKTRSFYLHVNVFYNALFSFGKFYPAHLFKITFDYELINTWKPMQTNKNENVNKTRS